MTYWNLSIAAWGGAFAVMILLMLLKVKSKWIWAFPYAIAVIGGILELLGDNALWGTLVTLMLLGIFHYDFLTRS